MTLQGLQTQYCKNLRLIGYKCRNCHNLRHGSNYICLWHTRICQNLALALMHIEKSKQLESNSICTFYQTAPKMCLTKTCIESKTQVSSANGKSQTSRSTHYDHTIRQGVILTPRLPHSCSVQTLKMAKQPMRGWCIIKEIYGTGSLVGKLAFFILVLNRGGRRV